MRLAENRGRWKQLSKPKPEQVALFTHPAEGKFNSQSTDSIEWARWSWNPVTGCLHDCSYCNARDLAKRHYEQGFVPTLHPSRLAIASIMKVPEQANIAGILILRLKGLLGPVTARRSSSCDRMGYSKTVAGAGWWGRRFGRLGYLRCMPALSPAR
jgi:hypothetical protein